MDAPQATPPSAKPPVGKIIQAAVIEAALLALGVTLFVMTGKLYWIILAAFAGGIVMAGLVVIPQVKRARDAQKDNRIVR